MKTANTVYKTDHTENKKFKNIFEDCEEAKEKIREFKEEYSLIFDNMDELITIINDKFEIEYVNKVACKKVLGWARVGPLKNFLNKIHPGDIKNILILLKVYWETGAGNGILRILHKNGQYIWLEAKMKTYITADEQKKAIIISKDITEHQKLQQRIIKSKNRYLNIYENTNDLICVINKKFKIEFINKNPHFQLLGFYHHDLIGEDIIKFIHLDDLPHVLETFKDLFKGQEITEILRLRRKDGTYIWTEVRGKSFLNLNGDINTIFVSRDISERKKIEEARNKLLKQIKGQNIELKQIDRLKDEFFADIVHDFRNPLTAIKGISESLLESENFTPKELKGLKIIVRNVKHLEYLIDELINYTKLKENIIQLQKHNFRVSMLINNLKQDFENRLSKKQLKIIDLYEPDTEIMLDKDQITRVLRNLLDNAIKFSNLNSEIKLSSKINDSKWFFSITDYGIGIKKENIPTIFRRFNKLKDSEKINTNGIGLGLTICKNIIEKYRGKIWVESPGRNHGATFHLEIPLKP
ncbi:MAG: PAS domain S-box protein [Promethearchaeota archaeon]